MVWRDSREAEGPHLLPLPDALVDKLRERRALDEAARPGRHHQLSVLVHHLTPRDGDHGHAVAHHALEDVVVHRLVVRASRDGPAVRGETSRHNEIRVGKADAQLVSVRRVDLIYCFSI